jgi:hypothetical protein
LGERAGTAQKGGNDLSSQDYQAALDELKAAERKPKVPKWEREVGDAIVAKVLDRHLLDGKFGESTRLIIETVDESSTEQGKPLDKGVQRSLACSPAMLADWVEAEDPQSEDVIAVYFAERVPSQSGGQPWHDLRAKVVRRGDEAF